MEHRAVPHSRYLTLGGAHVVMTDLRAGAHYAHLWECEGCRERSGGPAGERTCREEANSHAARCRAVPQTTGQ